MTARKRLNIGSTILGIGSLSLTGASFAMLMHGPDITTAAGRMLCAGAMANLSLSIIWALVAFIPLRRGERWAFWAFIIPITLYGIPMLILEGTQVSKEHLVSTLAPQVGGLSIAVIGLLIVAPALFAKKEGRE